MTSGETRIAGAELGIGRRLAENGVPDCEVDIQRRHVGGRSEGRALPGERSRESVVLSLETRIRSAMRPGVALTGREGRSYARGILTGWVIPAGR